MVRPRPRAPPARRSQVGVVGRGDGPGVPPDPPPDRAAPGRGAGASRLALPLGEEPDRRPDLRRSRVVGHVAVVGGGLAGIAAALDCADAGHRVTLLESRAWLGGATFSIERDGLWLDNGQHVFMRCCTAYRAFVERIGAADGVVLQDRLDVPVLAPGARGSRLRRSVLPAPLQLGSALARYPFLTAADKARLLPAVMALRRLPLDGPGVDGVTFAGWLAGHGQSANAVSALWDLITLPTVNLPAAEASLVLAAKVFKTGLLEETDAADIGYATVPLRELHHDRALAALEVAGVDVRLRASAAAVEAGTDDVVVRTEADAVEADAVVVAVTHEQIEALIAPHLPPGVSPGLLGRSAIVNLHVAYDRTVLDVPFAAGVRSPVQFVFDRTASSGLTDGQLLAVSLSGADALADSTIEELRA
ncbi:MAG: FAD-dependent oxidoreductase, partial [Actinobacteria bacterium]|nr:FAD-dependent oxidoreductase [Actinomycetota bacterium]